MSATVAVAGARPAGLVIGHTLQRAGISFVLPERRPRADLARHPKAALIEYRTIQLLREAGIVGSAVESSVPDHHCEFRRPPAPAVLGYSTLTGERPHYIYPQHPLVDRLCQALTGASADVRCGHSVEAVSHGPGGVTLPGTSRDGARSRQPVKARDTVRARNLITG